MSPDPSSMTTVYERRLTPYHSDTTSSYPKINEELNLYIESGSNFEAVSPAAKSKIIVLGNSGKFLSIFSTKNANNDNCLASLTLLFFDISEIQKCELL